MTVKNVSALMLLHGSSWELEHGKQLDQRGFCEKVPSGLTPGAEFCLIAAVALP